MTEPHDAGDHLDEADLDQFLRDGYLVVPQAFDVAEAADWIAQGWRRIGVDPTDHAQVASSEEKRIHLSTEQTVDADTLAPRAWAIAMDLLGGTDRAVLPWRWGNGFIANLGVGDDRPWDEPSAAVGGWHKDGDFFRHFLDSPEQGLLTIVLWTDMVHRGGGTFVATDSVGVVSRFLAGHPEGVLPRGFPVTDLIGSCRRFTELTGRAGDVVLMHPYMLHATSQNVINHPRLITNPPVTLREPMRFDREDADHSPVEQAVLGGLGVDRYAFAPTAEREEVVPPRVAEQRRRDQAAAARLDG